MWAMRRLFGTTLRIASPDPNAVTNAPVRSKFIQLGNRLSKLEGAGRDD